MAVDRPDAVLGDGEGHGPVVLAVPVDRHDAHRFEVVVRSQSPHHRPRPIAIGGGEIEMPLRPEHDRIGPGKGMRGADRAKLMRVAERAFEELAFEAGEDDRAAREERQATDPPAPLTVGPRAAEPFVGEKDMWFAVPGRRDAIDHRAAGVGDVDAAVVGNDEVIGEEEVRSRNERPEVMAADEPAVGEVEHAHPSDPQDGVVAR